MRPRSDTLLVWTGAPCSYGCAACPIDPQGEAAGIETADLVGALGARAGEGPRLAVLLGGEPFLRRDLFRLIAAIRAAEWAPGIVTSGRPLVYPQMRERLRRSGLAYLRIQLFGVGDDHDRATGVPGGFDQALAGVRAWLAERSGEACDVDVALSTRSRTIDAVVPEVESLARAIGSPRAQIVIAIEPGHPQAEALRRATAALEHWNDDATRPLLVWEGIPDSGSPTTCLRRPRLQPAFVAAAPNACCLGVVRALAEEAPVGVGGTRANSFNFLRTEVSVAYVSDPRHCTAHDAAGAGEPRRLLWLIEGDRLVLHATDTADFTAAEIARVKDEWSHVFLDRAPAGVLDDIREGMRRVLPDQACDSCAHRAECGRRYRIVEGAPFAYEEAWIARHVAGLSGRVLDVGCGEQKYLDELAPLVRSGAVRYTGLDPDEPSLARLRGALPEARLQSGGIEDFHGEAASYDHVLCLRSLNHVVDLDEALRRMTDLLAPGGSLLIVETTPFAMLRSGEQVAAADRAPRAGHQHFRNAASDDVLPWVRRLGLRVLEHRPAGLATTNEWILLLGREPAGPA